MFTNQYQAVSTARQKGDRAQQNAEFFHMGKISRHDDRRWYMASDLEQIKASVKADGFSLADARTNMGETFDEKWADFRKRVASRLFIYVTAENTAYYMNIDEFETFVKKWCYLSTESSKNGGGKKIRCKHESQKMRDWLAAQVA